MFVSNLLIKSVLYFCSRCVEIQSIDKRDSTIYENPNKFNPDRFLDASSKLCLSNDVTLAFGAGRRVCAGETFTRNMLFLLITSFLQAFNVRIPKGEKPYKFSENLTVAIRSTPDHWIEVTAR